MNILSSSLTFAPIRWWAYAITADNIIIDHAEQFRKMSYRNRYHISGSNNPIQLTVPLAHGRDQHTRIGDIMIYNADKWQVQHWRTLVSVYRRSPFWEFYEPSLHHLFENSFIHLAEFNLVAFQWLQKQLKFSATITIADTPPELSDNTIDLRAIKLATDRADIRQFPRYYQVFEDRIGFQPNLSILDLLFSEGPNTISWIKDNIPL